MISFSSQLTPYDLEKFKRYYLLISRLPFTHLAKVYLISVCNEYLYYVVFNRSVRLVCDQAQDELESSSIFSRVLRLRTNHRTYYCSSELTELKPDWTNILLSWQSICFC
jgi:hypothetical protein